MTEAVDEFRDTATFQDGPLAAVAGGFDTRWAAWVVRGQVHEGRIRRRFVVAVAVMAIVAAIACAFLA